MNVKMLIGVVALALGATSGQAVAQEGDPEAGEQVFRRCQACHMVGENAQARVGPPLNDLFGRVAGTYEGFNRYSPAIKEAGEAGLVWNADTISAYIENPREYIPGNRMAFAGLSKDEDRQNVIAYLKQFDDEPEDDDTESTYTAP